MLEKGGYDVIYQGAVAGKKDRGCDLIVKKMGNIYLVQCKRWKEGSIIREKYIHQLYGIVEVYKKETNKNNIFGIFVTTTKVSKEAKEDAEKLNIKVLEEIKMSYTYPIVKCNINRKGEKIYHLPFDKYYDYCKIIKEGEFYANTIEEAEIKGFRHAELNDAIDMAKLIEYENEKGRLKEDAEMVLPF